MNITTKRCKKTEVLIEDLNEHIQTLFKKNNYKCSHLYINNAQYVNDNFLCVTIIDVMNHMLDNNIVIDDFNIEMFYALVTHRIYNATPCCIQYNTIDIIDLTEKLFSHQLPSLKTVDYLLQYSIFNSCIINLKNNKSFVDNCDEYINYIIVHGLNKHFDTDTLLCEFIIDNINLVPLNLLNLCECSNSFIMDKLPNLIENYDGDLSEFNFMEAACKNLPYSKNIIIALLHKNCQVTNDNFEFVCETCDLESIEFILGISRINITSEHFKIIIDIIKDNRDDSSSHLYGYKNKYNTKSINDDNPDDIAKLELFFRYGYIPSRDDIKLTIINNIEIQNIDRFGIVMDVEMLDLCRKHNFFPKYNFACISLEMLELQKACKAKDLQTIKKLIKEHNLIPDEVCMENISYYRENTITEYLLKHGGKVNLKCINKRLDNYRNVWPVTILLEYYEKENGLLIKNYENRILELETQLSQIKNSPEQPVPSQQDECIPEIKYNVLNINVSNENIIEYSQIYKNKKIPHKNIIKLFTIDKTQRVSFSDFKKLLIEKIKNDDWLCENDRTLICIPVEHRTFFGLSSSGDNINDVVSFNDIDKLVYLFYKINCD